MADLRYGGPSLWQAVTVKFNFDTQFLLAWHRRLDRTLEPMEIWQGLMPRSFCLWVLMSNTHSQSKQKSNEHTVRKCVQTNQYRLRALIAKSTLSTTTQLGNFNRIFAASKENMQYSNSLYCENSLDDALRTLTIVMFSLCLSLYKLQLYMIFLSLDVTWPSGMTCRFCPHMTWRKHRHVRP